MDETEFKDGMEKLSRIVRSNHENIPAAAVDRQLRTCKICGYRWDARTGFSRPRLCPSCRSTLWDRDDVRKVRCFRCGHIWTTSLAHPLRCPSCASDRWYLETVEMRCRTCSSKWLDPLPAGRVPECPQCGPVGRKGISVISQKDTAPKKNSLGRVRPLPELYGMFLNRGGAVVDEGVMICQGFTAEQAGILHEFMCGSGAVDIARRNRKTLAEVLDVVSPYVSAVGGGRTA